MVNIAGQGFHIGVDLVKNRTAKKWALEEAKQIMYHRMDQGVALKIVEGNIITMRPSLILTKDDCNLIINSIKNALKELK